MQYFMIENKGEVLPEAFTLLGASSKEDDNTKIGFFGSGNKYAIACLLRNDIDLIVYAGDQEITFGTLDKAFRGDAFKQITVNGDTTSITTRTGPNWEVWMALRELICNAIDEGGYSYSVVDSITHEAGITRVFVEYTAEVANVVNDIDKLLAFKREIIAESADGTVRMYESTNSIYRKGIRCVPWDSEETLMYDYDIDTISLNESRLYESSWDVSNGMRNVLSSCTNKDVIRNVIVSALCDDYKNTREATLSWSSYTTLSTEWRDVILEFGKPIASIDSIRLYTTEQRPTYLWLNNDLYESALRLWPELPHAGSSEYIEIDAPQTFRDTIQHALKDLRLLGYDWQYPIRYVSFANKNYAAQYCKTTNEVLVTPHAELAEGDTWTTVLLEELTHAVTGFADNTRRMQDYLFRELLAAKRKAVAYDRIIATITQGVHA